MKINNWLDMLWKLDKEQKNKDIQELRTFLFQQRNRIKQDIKLIGISPSGLNIYSFKFIDAKYGEGTWQGVMADEVEHIPGAVIEWKGLKYVNYNEVDAIDVEFKQI